eukprot:TRINITY_DN17688_c0_g1_i1.p1 TRINITY_DN17688_c0_g1~~TRINITY_DN17688_c0_g1_i1.p1  ORF type:complete len:365 (-),score=36.50 TRINITY_DN17688_c0_g1_i1:98-1192(-)
MKILGVIFFDVVLAIFYQYLEIHNLFEYANEGQWAYVITMGAILIAPGTLELLHMTCEFYNGNLAGWREWWWWVGFCAFFPWSCIIWNLWHCCKGTKHFKRYEINARNKVLNSVAHLTKSPMQMIFQSTVLMLEWFQHDGFFHLTQPLILLVSLIQLAKHETDHYFFETSGKDVEATFKYVTVTRKFMFNIIHISVRVVTYALLASYLKIWMVIFFGLEIFALLVLAKITLKTKMKKNFLTSVSGIILPTGAFMSRDSFTTRDDAEARFTSFSRGNFFIYVTLVSAGLFAATLLISFYPEHIDCGNIPALSFDHGKQCPHHSPISELSKYLEPRQADMDHRFFFISTFGVGILSCIHFVMVWCE